MTQVPAVVRLVRRKTVNEIAFQDFLEVVFYNENATVDPALSVYVIERDRGRLVQVNAEHTANIPLGPSDRGAIDLSNYIDVPCEQNCDGGHFRYREASHYEVLFGYGPQAIQHATAMANALHPIVNDRFLEIHKIDIRNYARVLYAAQDSEWIAVCNVHPQVKRWASS